MLIGQGIDAHRFAPHRRLILGGIEVPHPLGLEAHSDGDVVLHALCDALLGAAGLGDIGHHFPDSDDAFKDIDSRVLLRRVVQALAERDLRVHNADLTVVAQAPKLAAYIDAMRECIAADLDLPGARVNIKATTSERMGFTGRGEGIAAFAVVLLDDSEAAIAL
ncbi:MAG: 2-C-methyl-D-erythritol 2,4-cyclodiphosphate synthase [Lamprobacter sp.]|uniref:2-C-methyl-D-erythritol 2,4-cyclodiphosphate synthase n=1 Tax=Lamprobacter sp. TaxID=3100796 RepID=UPI002B25A17F|nr:2-C-methyl-D-erythritol 2,4-cyclodiphosphate synthase [Lamprobacter sp.]MEA3640110.1 2-C-methyl-D-erythritol 2,4-cyclodiphosphate synthase [Lamprobacter sp.]